MQIKVTLTPEGGSALIPPDYNYYLNGAVHTTLQAADKTLSAKLHHGEEHRNRIKLFCFSSLYMPQNGGIKRPEERRGKLVFDAPTCLLVSSPCRNFPDAFGNGLMAQGQMRVGAACFRLLNVEPLALPEFRIGMMWRTAPDGACVSSWTSRKTNRKRYVYPGMSVEGHRCRELLAANILHKWRRFCEVDPEEAGRWVGRSPEDAKGLFEGEVKVHFPRGRGRVYERRTVYVKGTPVGAWADAVVGVLAPEPLQRLVLSCGLGQMNSMGFGLCSEAGEL